MKKGLFLLLSAALLATGVFGQKNDPVLMTVGNEQVTLSEFEAIFRKNNNNKPITKEALDEYIELFTKFKLRVKEAKELKMDTARAFVNELTGYVKQLAQPYLKDKDAEDRLLHETYDRFKWDLKIRHILVKVPECANPKDTLAAWTKIDKIRKDVMKNKNFEDAAKKFSEDTVSAKQGGLLGYFTALTLAYAFESAAYKLNPGEISVPVRTSYGYHIIKVDEKRPARGRVKVAHIFIAANPKDQVAYTNAQKKINEAYEKIMAGEEFGSVCKTYSEDYNTSGKGGELAPFGINQMVQEFEDAAFNLNKPGEVTKPFSTGIGFHIIKLIEKLPTPAYDDYKNELQKNVSRNKRWQSVKDVFTANLKKEYKFTENTAFMTTLETEAAKNGGKLNKEQLSSVPDQELFRINGTPYMSKEFVNSMLPKMQNNNTLDICMLRKTYYNPYVAQKLSDYKEANLPNEYQDFRMLVNEYRDGILLFNLMDQKVWSKSVRDTSGLKNYHEAHKDKYMWGERLKAYVLDCRSDTAETLARKYADKLASGKMTKEKFLATVNKKIKDNVFISEGIYNKGDNAMVDAIGWQTGVGSTEKKDGKIRFAVVVGKVAPMPKTLKEAKGLVISDYQTYLEAEWIKELQGKYPISVNKEVLYTLIGK